MTNSVSMGGMEEHVRLLAREIDRSRFEVTGLAPEWEPTEQFSAGLAEAADRFGYASIDRRYGLRNQVEEAWRLWRRARSDRYDIAHLHSTTYGGLTAAIVVLRAAGVRRILVTEHLAPEQAMAGLARTKRRLLMGLVSGLVCVSENNRRFRARYLGVPAGKTYVVNNGIDVSRFGDVAEPGRLASLRAELGIEPGMPVVGTAIRFEPGKGVNDLVEAFAIVRKRHPDATLLMVGDGSLRPQLEALTRDLGIADASRFVGFQTDPRLFIQLMDAFVLPVPFGSASIALLEAMAMSRPCVITFGGDREAVQHGESGFCAQPGDPSSIADCVCALFEDPIRRKEIGRKARLRVDHHYSASRMVRALEDIYWPGFVEG